ncbi:hypothetical protein ACJA25_00410 [Mycoplasmopsis hyopharyngis]|uniref:hypothetical protein n=1 Tax=Mycoplasmopsis hyopharyngis TaxID=29558 RepID=UPI00387314DF
MKFVWKKEEKYFNLETNFSKEGKKIRKNGKPISHPVIVFMTNIDVYFLNARSANKKEQNSKNLKVFELFKIINRTKINFFVVFDFYKIIRILRSAKSFEDFSNEFYILVICNFNQIQYANKKFVLSNFVWLWNNRKAIYENYLK